MTLLLKPDLAELSDSLTFKNASTTTDRQTDCFLWLHFQTSQEFKHTRKNSNEAWNGIKKFSLCIYLSKVLVKCNHRFGIPKAQLCEHTHMEIETDKEIMISIYHWMQKLSCHQDKSEFVTP